MCRLTLRAVAIPQLGNDQQVGATVQGMKPGEVSDVLQAGNKLAVAVVTGTRPPHPAQLSEVESQVRQNYLQGEANRMVTEKAAKAAELLKQNGGDLKAAAKAVGGEVKTADFFSRNGAAEGIGSATLLSNLFDKPDGSVFGPLGAGGQTIVGKVTGHQDADMSKFPQAARQYRHAAQEQRGCGPPKPLAGQHPYAI